MASRDSLEVLSSDSTSKFMSSPTYPQQMLNALICWALWIPYSFSGQESNQGTLECLHGCLHNEGTTDFSCQASQTWKTEAKSWPDHSNFMVVGRTLSAPSSENTTYKWPHAKLYLPSSVSGLKWSPPCRWNYPVCHHNAARFHRSQPLSPPEATAQTFYSSFSLGRKEAWTQKCATF